MQRLFRIDHGRGRPKRDRFDVVQNDRFLPDRRPEQPESVRFQRVQNDQHGADRVHEHDDRDRTVRLLLQHRRLRRGQLLQGHANAVLRRVHNGRQPETDRVDVQRRRRAEVVRRHAPLVLDQRVLQGPLRQADRLRPRFRPGVPVLLLPVLHDRLHVGHDAASAQRPVRRRENGRGRERPHRQRRQPQVSDNRADV